MMGREARKHWSERRSVGVEKWHDPRDMRSVGAAKTSKIYAKAKPKK